MPARTDLKFNRKDGHIGLRGLDNTKAPSICFCDKEEISTERIKISSRGLTRIFIPEVKSGELDEKLLIKYANEILNEWRGATSDIFLTAFKSVRADGRYRRRLSYDIANQILAQAIDKLKKA